MRLSAKARYAVTAMLDIALHADCAPIALVDIATRQNISLMYLEQLFCRLRRRGLVASIRGPAGGYLLGQDVRAISVGMIIQAVDEEVDATRCSGKKSCQNGKYCLTHNLWSSLNQHIYRFLSQITLHELVHEQSIPLTCCVAKPQVTKNFL